MVAYTRRRFVVLAAAAAIALPVFTCEIASAGEVLTVVDGYIGAWNAHDAKAAAGFFSDGATYFDASVGTPVTGREEAQHKVIEAFLNAAPDAKWQRTGKLVELANNIAFEWTFSGTNTGDWSDGTKATGKPFSFNGLSIVTVDGGKITYQADYYDALGFYKQLGLQ